MSIAQILSFLQCSSKCLLFYISLQNNHSCTFFTQYPNYFLVWWSMMRSWLNHSVQHTIHIIDPAISSKLRDAKETPMELSKWFTYCNFEVVDVLLLPYHNRYVGDCIFWDSFLGLRSLEAFDFLMLFSLCSDHWSFASINIQQKQCFIFNSLKNTHTELKL